MAFASEPAALAAARRLLSEWLDNPKPRFRQEARGAPSSRPIDLLVEYGSLRLFVEYKASGDAAAVGRAAEQVKASAREAGGLVVPVVAVPFMGDVGRAVCSAVGVSWFDLSGNAHLVAPGLRVIVGGNPNRFLRRGRPSTPFAPKSARIARRLLIDSKRSFTQHELARLSGLDNGFTSRIVRRLEERDLVLREDGRVRVRDPGLLLDAWAEAYDFKKHDILRGHATARTSEELLRRVATTLERQKVRHAATGLAGAWLLDSFAGFRLVTLYVAEGVPEATLKEIGFRAEPSGANLWLVTPNDDGVFDGGAVVNGIACVHPVQAYVDLLGHPERAKEAASELRTRILGPEK